MHAKETPGITLLSKETTDLGRNAMSTSITMMTPRCVVQAVLPVGFAKRPPKDFKLPHDRQKFDGIQEPESWLSDYLQTVKLLGGTKATAMQSLQLHLSRAARSWLRKLPNECISSWDDLAD